MPRRSVTVGISLLLVGTLLIPANAIARTAGATAPHRPAKPVITEPGAAGQRAHPGDVHMETAAYSDADGDAHRCTTWLIKLASSGTRVWEDRCDTSNKVHVHLGDGTFVGPYAGRAMLKFGRNYVLQVRHQEQSNRPIRRQWSLWSRVQFRTSAKPAPGTSTAWTVSQEGFRVDVVAGGLKLPVNIAFLPTAPVEPSDPYFYVTELHGAIKVVAKDGTVSDYFNNVLNYAPPLSFPGSGEQGLTGIVVDPATGDVIVGMMYEGPGGAHYPRIVRFHSNHGGAVADSSSIILDMPAASMGPSHQISNLSIGPDGKLYAHLGDGFQTAKAQDLSDFRGKILRLNLDGTAPEDNPFYDASDGIAARDYVFAYGFRNPFGGAWRAADGQHYEVENGPSVDRLAKIVAGRNYLWDGTDTSMTNYALYQWNQPHAPVNITFVEQSTFNGSGFPADKLGHAFVSEAGPTHAKGPQTLGKRIVEFVLDPTGDAVTGPTNLIEYSGTGWATVTGLTAGPDGLYFTDLYKDDGTAATDRGARVLKVTWVGTD
jgi:glucose/arabinose dehydrogenase